MMTSWHGTRTGTSLHWTSFVACTSCTQMGCAPPSASQAAAGQCQWWFLSRLHTQPERSLCWAAPLHLVQRPEKSITTRATKLLLYLQVLHGDLKSSNVVLNACHTCAKVSPKGMLRMTLANPYHKRHVQPAAA